MSGSNHAETNDRPVSKLLALGRAAEWWEYKFIPAMAVGYATSLYLGADQWSALGGLAWLLFALLPGGIFVSVLNDLTDRSDDAAAGKSNRQTGLGIAGPIAIILACLGLGALIAWLWRSEPVIVTTYAVAWLAFTLYSVPPFRLKRRGLAGVLCDATGANLVPALLAAQFAASALGRPIDPHWLIPVGVWALMFGLRGILYHQIGDLDADLRSDTPTFVARVGALSAKRLVRWLTFPLEALALGLIVAQLESDAFAAALIALGLYLVLIHERVDRFQMRVTLVAPEPRSCLLLHEYYDVFLPLSLLVAGFLAQPMVVVVLGLHCLLFPVRMRQVLNDLIKLLDPQYQRRPRRWRRR